MWGWTGLQQYQPTERATVAAWAESPARGEETKGQCELDQRDGDKVMDN